MQPEIMIEIIVTFFKKNSLIILLILFLAVDIIFSTLAFKNQQNLQNRPNGNVIFLQKESAQNYPFANAPKISEIQGPRIDDQAAAVERVAVCDNGKKGAPCATFPARIWMFLLLAYIGLLIFNLAYDFESAVKIQWFWELLYTLLAIGAWFVWDPSIGGQGSCGTMNLWYPEFVLKAGIVIYGIYLYFFRKTKNKQMSLL